MPRARVLLGGLCQLFEHALVRMFGAFGRREALAQVDSDDVTPRLRTTLVRLTNSPGRDNGKINSCLSRRARVCVWRSPNSKRNVLGF